MKKLVIIGAGGHGAVAADIARLQHYDEIIFLDDHAQQGRLGFPLKGNVEDFLHYLEGWDFFVAIGNSKVREKIQRMLTERNAHIETLIHPNAVIAEDVQIGKGCIVMAGAVVNAGAVIEDGVILNTCCSVDHDCVVGVFSHIAVGAHVCGTVCIGEHVWIGAGATVINNISICDDTTIGAGAVVVKSIVTKGVYIGMPAKSTGNCGE